MKQIDSFPLVQAKEVKYLLTDIDDTLTNAGRIPGCAYLAMEKLQQAGIKVLPITGRPAGWCDLIARMWPVDGVVGENGAFYFRYDYQSKKMEHRYAKSPQERADDRIKLEKVRDDVLRTVPGCALSADQFYREADLAIDFCEDVPPLADADIEKIVEIFENHGAGAKISSIHVNGWFGSYNKLSMTKILFDELFGLDLEMVKEQVVFAGDSPNDEPMFDYFPNSVGVANVLRCLPRLKHKPTWVTGAEGGYGFAQIADHLLRATLENG